MRRANAAVAAAGKANTRAMACGCMLSCGKSAVETVEADMPGWNQQEINRRCGYDLGIYYILQYLNHTREGNFRAGQ